MRVVNLGKIKYISLINENIFRNSKSKGSEIVLQFNYN